MKRDGLCFIVGMLIFLGVQNTCLFIRTNLWMAQFIVVKQMQLQQIHEAQKIKHEQEKKKQQEQQPISVWDKQLHDFTTLLEALHQAKGYQEERKTQLDKLADQLKNEREALQLFKQSIEILQAKFEEHIVSIKASEVKNLKILADTYTNMAPDSVAKIFAESEETTVVKIMHFISPETLGPIFQAIVKETFKNKENSPKLNRLLERFRLSEEVKK